MTEKDLQGNITISPDALRQDLETSEIKVGHMADDIWANFADAHRALFCSGTLLLSFSDASDETLRTLAEAHEIIGNLKIRISPEEPTTTAKERHVSNP